MPKAKNILFPFLLIILPVFSSYFYQPTITGSISNIIPIILLPYFFKNYWIRPFYFILLPLLLATRTPDSLFYYSYEFIILILFLLTIKTSIFKNNFKIPKIFFVFFYILIYQIIISLLTATLDEATFSMKIFFNYSLSFIYLITFTNYCLGNIKYLDSIIYAFGFSGPLTGLIAIGYKFQGIQMLQSSLGEDFDPRFLKYSENDIFHYATLLKYTYTNVSLICLLSIFAWLIILRRNQINNIYQGFISRINLRIFYKLMFIFSIIILFLFTSKSTIFSLIIVAILYSFFYISNNLTTSPLIIKFKSIKLFLLSLIIGFSSYIGIDLLIKAQAVLGDLSGNRRLSIYTNLFSYWANDLNGNLSLFFGKGLFLDFKSLDIYLDIVDGENALDSFWLGFTFKAGLITTLIILYFISKEIKPALKKMEKELKILTIFSLIAIGLANIAIVIGSSKVLWLLLAYLAYISKSHYLYLKNHE